MTEAFLYYGSFSLRAWVMAQENREPQRNAEPLRMGNTIACLYGGEGQG